MCAGLHPALRDPSTSVSRGSRVTGWGGRLSKPKGDRLDPGSVSGRAQRHHLSLICSTSLWRVLPQHSRGFRRVFPSVRMKVCTHSQRKSWMMLFFSVTAKAYSEQCPDRQLCTHLRSAVGLSAGIWKAWLSACKIVSQPCCCGAELFFYSPPPFSLTVCSKLEADSRGDVDCLQHTCQITKSNTSTCHLL